MSDTGMHPGGRVLETWANHSWNNGLQLESITDFGEIHVQTKNSTYEITVIDGFARDILVRGGRFYPERTRARLDGSSLGGSFLKLGGIYVGFSLEIVSAGRTVTTTRIRSITVYRPPELPVSSKEPDDGPCD